MRKTKPIISVVIPAYNEEKYLSDCLNSLKNQDFDGEYEIIVVDNNSTDNTRIIAEKSGVRVLFEPQRGVCAARQKGSKAAEGEIIVSTDADCVFAKNWLNNIYRALNEDKKIVAITGPIEYSPPPKWGVWYARLLFGTISRIYSLRKKIIYVSAANFAFRKKTLFEIGGYNTKLTQGGDENYLLKKFVKRGGVIYSKNNKVISSSRRLKHGTIYGLFVILLYYYFFDYFIASRFTNRSITGPYPATREEKLQNSRHFVRKSFLFFIFIGALIYYLFFSSNSQVFGKVVSSIKGQEKIIALTFDDGPNEPYTSEIANVLDSYNIKGTFFEVGQNIEKYPETTARLFEKGHVIANHSYSHSLKKPIVRPFFNDEIEKTQQIIYEITGKKPRLFRPPWLFRDPLMLKTANQYNLVVVTGRFGNDFEVFQPDYKKIAESAIEKAKPGMIFIFHDGYDSKGANRKETVMALKIIIPELINKGYDFVTVPELLSIEPYQ